MCAIADQSVTELCLFAKERAIAKKKILNGSLVPSTTYLRKNNFLTACSIPPAGQILVPCYRTHWIPLIRNEIYVREPAVWRHAVESSSSQHTDSKFRGRDILGPGHCGLVSVLPGWVEVIYRKQHVNGLAWKEKRVVEWNLSALSFCVAKINKSSTSVE